MDALKIFLASLVKNFGQRKRLGTLKVWKLFTECLENAIQDLEFWIQFEYFYIVVCFVPLVIDHNPGYKS